MRAEYCVQAAVPTHPPFILLGIYFFHFNTWFACGKLSLSMVLRPSVVATCSDQNTGVLVYVITLCVFSCKNYVWFNFWSGL